jgi:ABC-type polysaccharide/polyol phosphate export permease
MRRYMWINPLYGPVEFFRFSISGINPIPPEAFLPGMLLTAVVLTTGLFWFNHAQRNFIDVV